MASPIKKKDPQNPNPPWSQLPTELLELISDNFAGNISDFIRFRCVCRSWRHASKPSNLSRHHLPWLLLPYDPDSTIRSFFSFATESTRSLLLPETRHQNICGSSNGWLVMIHQETLTVSLFNPLTRSLFRLPPISDGGAAPSDCFAFISPDQEPDGMVAFVAAGSPEIHYCKLRDEKWTAIDSGLKGRIKTMTFHKGRFYLLDSNGTTAVCELEPAEREISVIPLSKLVHRYSNYCSSMFFVTFGGELMLVTCHKDYINENYFAFDKMIFEYHKLEEGMMAWMRIEGVGDCSLFVTDGKTQSQGRLMVVASDAPGYKENCLYYVVPPRLCRKGLSLMHVLVVDEGDVRRYYGPWAGMEPMPMSSTWFVPSLC